MFTFVAVLTLAIAGPRPLAAPRAVRPMVQVWTNRGESPYPSGETVRVMFQTEQDAFVTVLQVDTDGRVRVLFPREPWEDNFARSRRVYEVPDAGAPSGFRADDDPGQGYLFAVAAPDPFRYHLLVASDQRWNYELIADGGRIRGDPYAALTDLAARMVPDGNRDWDYDIAPYYVQRHYDYPRFLCYDCHASVGFQTWNPYDYSCVRFRVVVFDDPYYYPYRSYGGTRAVFRRPLRPEPRFIFRDRGPSDAFLTRVGERPVNDNRRRDVGVRGQDIGRFGAVPPPHAITPRGLRNPTDRVLRRESRGQQDTARSKPSAPPRRPETGGAPPTRRTPATTEPARPRERPRAEPARPRERPRAEPARPREGPRAEPARPRERPRAEPARGGERDNGRRSEPELRRRKPQR